MTINELKEQYKEDITIQEELVDKQVFKLPIILNKYQIMFHNILTELSDIKEQKDKVYYDIMHDYRIGNSELSNFTWSTTELQKMVNTSPTMRELTHKETSLEADLKLVEEMIQNIRNISFQIKNYIDYKKLIMGVM